MPAGSGRACGRPEISLPESQNPDGGWPYQTGGPSWTEPTAYALLALQARRSADAPLARGLRWLEAAQLPDGGWPPQPAVRQSTWVTAAAALLGPVALGESSYHRAIDWILRQTGADANLPSRLRQFLTGKPQPESGWPWFPGTSAWVTPTALSMLALRKAQRFSSTAQIGGRWESGMSYLVAHACADGGWNHGAARTLDYDAPSYPETTGVALLALAGQMAPQVRRACDWAGHQLAGSKTSEGQSWLRLGLLANGRQAQVAPADRRTPRTIQNAALALLVESAAAGHNSFLE